MEREYELLAAVSGSFENIEEPLLENRQVKIDVKNLQLQRVNPTRQRLEPGAGRVPTSNDLLWVWVAESAVDRIVAEHHKRLCRELRQQLTRVVPKRGPLIECGNKSDATFCG